LDFIYPNPSRRMISQDNTAILSPWPNLAPRAGLVAGCPVSGPEQGTRANSCLSTPYRLQLMESQRMGSSHLYVLPTYRRILERVVDITSLTLPSSCSNANMQDIERHWPDKGTAPPTFAPESRAKEGGEDG